MLSIVTSPNSRAFVPLQKSTGSIMFSLPVIVWKRRIVGPRVAGAVQVQHLHRCLR